VTQRTKGAIDFLSEADGAAKTALIALDRLIGARTVVPRYNRLHTESVFGIISLLDLLGQAVEETFPGARSFIRIRPGFDSLDPNTAGADLGS
jgi:hypothetical protein